MSWKLTNDSLLLELQEEIEKRQLVADTLGTHTRNLANVLRAIYLDTPRDTELEKNLMSAQLLATWAANFAESAEQKAIADLDRVTGTEGAIKQTPPAAADIIH